MRLRLLGFFTLMLLGSVVSFAQVTTSAISGTITDNGGSPLIGATIVATHTPSGAIYGTTTREDGRFDLPNVRIGGPYKIEVSYIGYQPQMQENVFLKLGQKYTVNMSLSDESTTLGEVMVTAERNSILGKERTGAETNVGSDKLERLPTISRSASDFTRLTPASDGNSFGGRNDQFNNFSLDGSIFNNPFGLDAATAGGQSGAQPISLDAIDQITVSLAPYDVTQAGFTGAAVNAVTKSGTNDFSGSVFGFFRNEGLTGGKVSGTEQPKADLNQFQGGFTLGGPIIKNKLFFFLNAEVDNRDDLGTTFIARAPGLNGENVSRVEASDLQTVSDLLMQRYGYETGPYEGYIHATNSTKGLAKLDWNINSSNSLVLTYNFLDAFKEKPAHPSAIGRRGPDFTTLQFANSGYRINNNIQSGILEFRSLFGNKAANKLQVGYTTYRDTRDPFSDPFPVININRDGIRYIVAGHEPFSINNRLNQDVFQFTDNLNIYAGKHTITVGTSFERFAFDNSFNLNAYGGTFDGGFASVDAFVDSLGTGGYDAIVDAAKETFDRNGGNDGELGAGWALAETNAGQFAVYAQDEWQINDRFNLTYGVRMDMPLYFNTSTLIQENIDRNCCHAPEIQWYDKDDNLSTVEATRLPDQTPLISPRIGFNYDMRGDGTRQLRGGSGLFSGRLPFVWLGNHVANPNWFFYNYTDNDFKFPQVWRTNLGYDHKFASGWIATADLIFTKDLNASIVRNAGLKSPTGTLNGVDNRPVYTFNDKAVFN
ncbi:MAG: carboxypeptidase regulatory-like domain-containing protein, partial [Bacteroidota bacterium]